MEKDQTIASMQQTIEELKQKAEQGSQQLQGKVQELELENLLRCQVPVRLHRTGPQGRIRRRCPATGCQPEQPAGWHDPLGM
jgi:hypothetical protein